MRRLQVLSAAMGDPRHGPRMRGARAQGSGKGTALEREAVAQPGRSKGPLNCRGNIAPDAELLSGLLGHIRSHDQHSEAGGVDEPHLGEIDENL